MMLSVFLSSITALTAISDLAEIWISKDGNFLIFYFISFKIYIILYPNFSTS